MPPSLTLFHNLLLFSTAFIAGGLNAVAGGGSFIIEPHLIRKFIRSLKEK